MLNATHASTHPDVISPCASASGLPHSMVMMVAMSLRWSRIKSCHLCGGGGGGQGEGRAHEQQGVKRSACRDTGQVR